MKHFYIFLTILIAIFLNSNQAWRIENVKYRLSETGCPCWFDLEGDIVPLNGCACCTNGGIQVRTHLNKIILRPFLTTL